MQRVGTNELPTDLLDLLRRRYEVLALLDTSTYEKPPLTEVLGVSRSTIDRAMRDLRAAKLVRRTDDGYRTTLYGRVVVTIYESHLHLLEQVRDAKTLLAELPPEIDFDVGLVVDADVILAEGPALHAPAARIADIVRSADELRGLAHAHTSPEALEVFTERILDDQLPTELVLRRQMYENLRANYPAAVEEVVAADAFTVYVAPDVPFGLFLSTDDGDRQVCLNVYNADGRLEGVLVNDAPEAVEWGTRIFERYRARGTRLSDD